MRDLLGDMRRDSANFTIVNWGREYPCHFVVLCAHCEQFWEWFRDGHHPNRLVLKSQAPFKYLQNVIDHFYGADIRITLENCAEITAICRSLGAKQLLNKAEPIYEFGRYTIRKIVELKEGNDSPDVVDFLARFVETLRFFSETETLPAACKLKILKSERLKIFSEESLLDWLVSLSERDGVLSVCEYLNVLDLERMSPMGWKQLLHCNVPLSASQQKVMKVEFVKDPRDRCAIDRSGPRYWGSLAEHMAEVVAVGRAQIERFSAHDLSYTTSVVFDGNESFEGPANSSIFNFGAVDGGAEFGRWLDRVPLLTGRLWRGMRRLVVDETGPVADGDVVECRNYPLDEPQNMEPTDRDDFDLDSLWPEAPRSLSDRHEEARLPDQRLAPEQSSSPSGEKSREPEPRRANAPESIVNPAPKSTTAQSGPTVQVIAPWPGKSGVTGPEQGANQAPGSTPVQSSYADWMKPREPRHARLIVPSQSATETASSTQEQPSSSSGGKAPEPGQARSTVPSQGANQTASSTQAQPSSSSGVKPPEPGQARVTVPSQSANQTTSSAPAQSGSSSGVKPPEPRQAVLTVPDLSANTVPISSSAGTKRASSPEPKPTNQMAVRSPPRLLEIVDVDSSSDDVIEIPSLPPTPSRNTQHSAPRTTPPQSTKADTPKAPEPSLPQTPASERHATPPPGPQNTANQQNPQPAMEAVPGKTMLMVPDDIALEVQQYIAQLMSTRNQSCPNTPAGSSTSTDASSTTK